SGEGGAGGAKSEGGAGGAKSEGGAGGRAAGGSGGKGMLGSGGEPDPTPDAGGAIDTAPGKPDTGGGARDTAGPIVDARPPGDAGARPSNPEIDQRCTVPVTFKNTVATTTG